MLLDNFGGFAASNLNIVNGVAISNASSPPMAFRDYGPVSPTGVIVAKISPKDGAPVRIYFCCDATRQNGWVCEINTTSQLTLYRIDDGAETIAGYGLTPLGVGEGWVTITIHNGKVSCVYMDMGNTFAALDVPLTAYADQSCVSLGIGANVADGIYASCSQIQMTA